MTDLELARHFLETLWPLDIPDGERVIITAQIPARDGRDAELDNAGASTIDGLLRIVERANAVGAHAWVNVATRRPEQRYRGGLAGCVTVPALWADLDVADGAPGEVHKGATFSTWAEVEEFLDRFPLPPSIVVRTGYGASAWWVLDEPIPAEMAAPLIDALKATVSRVSGGQADPSVYEVARMMRLPGTYNRKLANPQPRVEIERELTAARYSPSELAEHLDIPDPARPAAATSDALAAGTGRPGDDYNATATTDDVILLLAEAGAELVERSGTIVKMARPGKGTRNGHSLTVGWVGPAITFMFSSGWAELPPGTYTPFKLRAHLRHAGDFAACARELAALGYGSRAIDPLEALPELDGLHVAEDFVRNIGHAALHAPGAGWLLWDGTRYIGDEDGLAMMRHVNTYTKRLLARALADHRAVDDEDSPAKAATTKVLNRARSYLERSPRRNIVEDAASELSIGSSALDPWPELLNATNGVINLRTGELGPHDPALRLTKITSAPYLPGATSADWTRALSAISPAMRDYLQVLVGLSALGRSVADLLVLVYGSGGNGKGTILGAVVHTLHGYAVTVPAKLFTDQGTRETQLLMPLRGARFAMAAETGEDHMLNMERLKALSGGDPMTDRHLYSRTFATWEPTHTLWLQTNARPRVRNTDEGTWRRLRLVPFTSTYSRGTDVYDEGLRDRLRTDPANRAAILAWIVQGAMRWLRDETLPTCPEVEEASAAWRDEEDVIASFLADAGLEVTGDVKHWTLSSEVYRRYREHALASGMKPYGAPMFRREMERYAGRLRLAKTATFHPIHSKVGLKWVGIREAGAVDAITSPADEQW